MLDDGNEYPYGPARVFAPDGSGGLAVSRALGDLALRPAVSGVPESVRVARDPTLDLFAVVASDGVWDVLGHREGCVEVLRGGWIAAANADAGSELGESWCPRAGAQALIETALSRGSQDNCSAAVIRLEGA